MTRVFADAAAGRGGESGGRDARRSLDRQPDAVHRDEHRRHVRAARDGARSSSAALEPGAREAFRFLHVSTDEVYGTLGPSGLFSEDDALRAEFAVRGEQGVGGPPGARLLPHVRAAGADHELLEQLRAVSVSREADSADDSQRARRAAAADLRRRRQRARLAARRRSLRGTPARCSGKGRVGEKYNIGGGNERTNLEIVDRVCDALDGSARRHRIRALEGRRATAR